MTPISHKRKKNGKKLSIISSILSEYVENWPAVFNYLIEFSQPTDKTNQKAGLLRKEDKLWTKLKPMLNF